MTLEETDALDNKDRTLGVASHQKDLVDHAWDMASRWCDPNEMKDVFSIQEDFIEADTGPTEGELTSWEKVGMLTPGQGGRDLTRRKQNVFHTSNVGRDATEYEVRRLEMVKQWSPNFDWVPGMLAEGQRYFLIMYSGHRRWQDMATYIWWGSNLIRPLVQSGVT